MNHNLDPVVAGMNPPPQLSSANWQPWAEGAGTEVWKMLTASITGDISAVEQLLQESPSLLNCSWEYCTPLYFAIRENHFPLVEFLFSQYPRFQWKPAQLSDIAKKRGNHQMAAFVDGLLEKYFQIDPQGNVLAAAIRAGDTALVEKMITRQPSLLNMADEFGNKAIHWSVLTRQLPLISFLLSKGADINAKRPDGAKPLDLTNGDYYFRSWYRDLPPQAIRQHEVVAGYLIANGASYDIHIAAKFGDTSRVAELLQQDPSLISRLPDYISFYSGSALRNAAGAGHFATVKYLLEQGADPNMPEPGIAPEGGALHAAVAGKHRSIAQLLLEYGANPNAAVESSGNCMSMACYHNAPPELIDLLAAYGAAQTVELLCYYGNLSGLSQMFLANPQLPVPPEALDAAIGEGQQLMLELILRYHPAILKTHTLRKISNISLARWLMKHGLNPNNADWLGITPLHHAAGEGNIELAALCLEYGAAIDAIETDFNSSPLGWAARNGHRAMVGFLLQEGADHTAPRGSSWSQPAAWAERMGYEDIVLLLLN